MRKNILGIDHAVFAVRDLEWRWSSADTLTMGLPSGLTKRFP